MVYSSTLSNLSPVSSDTAIFGTTVGMTRETTGLPPETPASDWAAPSRSFNFTHGLATLKQLVLEAHKAQASDLHLRVGESPRFRVRGQMCRSQYPPITPEVFEQFLAEILTPAQRQAFSQQKDLDTSIYYPDLLRCRVNCFESLNGGGMVLRLISLDVPTVADFELPSVFRQLAEYSQGLLLVTGPTGAGKSTSIAAMIQHLNQTQQRHIVTIEDPIEYVHASQSCLISQREIGIHTPDIHQALRSVLREDPDVIVIGEMRDRQTIETAIKAAQTGHLVLGTLHTQGAIATINRLLNFYQPEEQPVMRMQLLESLVGVVAQHLLPTTDGLQTVAHEILINTPAMQDYLLQGNDLDAFQLMENSEHQGMQVMNQRLAELILLGKISDDAAARVSPDLGDLRRRVRNGGEDPGRSSHREYV